MIDHKEFPKSPGIYAIRNLTSNKLYVGSTVCLRTRIGWHHWHLKGNKHCNQYLQNSWNKYGAEDFEVSILQLWDKVETLREQEQYWIEVLDPEFNINPTAEPHLPGYKQPEAVKAKISKTLKGRKLSKKHIQNMRMKRTPGKKWCGFCKREHSLKAFSKDPNKWDKLDTRCLMSRRKYKACYFE